MWEFIDKVIYINLDHRQDRRDIMAEFFEKGNIPLEKVIRFPAIKREDGKIGAIYSHMEALKLAKQNGWKNVLICEDDLEWLHLEEGYKQLEEYIKFPNWHVIMLVGWYGEHKLPRIMTAGNAGCYLVNSSYYDRLIRNRQDSLNQLLGIRKWLRPNTWSFTVDVFWNSIMKVDNWYGLYPCICRQKNTYSDVSKMTYNASGVHGIYNGKGNLFVPIQNA
jgi:glycosyl transferase family 25